MFFLIFCSINTLNFSIEWKNDDEGGKTALHICAVGRRKENKDWKGIETAELLLQNGAKIESLDRDHHSVLDIAVIGNGERDMVEYLTARIS